VVQAMTQGASPAELAQVSDLMQRASAALEQLLLADAREARQARHVRRGT
jgi:hypothetical protein